MHVADAKSVQLSETKDSRGEYDAFANAALRIDVSRVIVSGA